MVDTAMNLKSEVTIALVGKYIELHDAYLSVAEAAHPWRHWKRSEV